MNLIGEYWVVPVILLVSVISKSEEIFNSTRSISRHFPYLHSCEILVGGGEWIDLEFGVEKLEDEKFKIHHSGS